MLLSAGVQRPRSESTPGSDRSPSAAIAILPAAVRTHWAPNKHTFSQILSLSSVSLQGSLY